MSRSLITLLFVGILLPSQICSDDDHRRSTRGHHNHHQHESLLDTHPNMDLSPARPVHRTTLRGWMLLPTLPSVVHDSDLMTDENSYYDYYTSESSGSDAIVTESQQSTATEEEYKDPHVGNKDHMKSGSSEVSIIARFLVFLPLVISIAALHLPQ